MCWNLLNSCYSSLNPSSGIFTEWLVLLSAWPKQCDARLLRQMQTHTEACGCVLEISLRDGQDFVRQPLCQHYTAIFAAALVVALPPLREVQVGGKRQCYLSVLLTMVFHLDPWNKHHIALEGFSANVQLCRTTAKWWRLWKVRSSRSLAGDVWWVGCVLQPNAHLAAHSLSLSTGQGERAKWGSCRLRQKTDHLPTTITGKTGSVRGKILFLPIKLDSGGDKHRK